MSSLKQIQISTDVFALIWASRLPGEEDENQILLRILNNSKPHTLRANSFEQSQSAGFHDNRHGVTFHEGFEIFRSYHSREYRAIASNSRWIRLDSKEEFSSLNQLSRSIGAKTENAWLNWMFLNERGVKTPLDELRPTASKPISNGGTMQYDSTWRDDTHSALKLLRTPSPLSAIYKAVTDLRASSGRSTPPSSDAIIRRTLEENCSETESYKGIFDLFRMPSGKGSGIWSLK